ncbi:hypothetical protein STENM223S_09888 [Streptomyces tendae]
MPEARLQACDEMDMVLPGLIDWRGGGPDVWEP